MCFIFNLHEPYSGIYVPPYYILWFKHHPSFTLLVTMVSMEIRGFRKLSSGFIFKKG